MGRKKTKASYVEAWKKRLEIKQNIAMAMAIISIVIAATVLLVKIVI